MKNFILATAIAVLASTSAFAAKPAACNPAIQNWENGSKTTCVYEGGRGLDAPSTPDVGASAPPSIPSSEDLNSQIK